MIFDSGPRNINGASPMFSAFQIDLKARTINLIGFSGSVEHFVDDGKGPPPNPVGAMLNPGVFPNGVPNLGLRPPNGFAPGNFIPAPNVRINRRPLKVLQELPANPGR
jgi:hypothetical protein